MSSVVARSSYVVVLIGIIVACVARPARDSVDPSRLPRDPAGSFSSWTAAAPADLSFRELQSILETRKFNQIDQLLAYLSSNKPDYMSHYTLGFASKSLHGSSRSNPRAIVFGSRGRFIISFNGSPRQDAYEMLEVVEFNEATKAFEFREIEFNESGKLDVPFKISEIGGGRVEGGPQRCLQCHTNNRPIWERYDTWPGFYGGDDDYPIATQIKDGSRSRFDLDFPAGVASNYAAFMNGPKNGGRYRFLPALANAAGESEPRPNLELSRNLTSLNLSRIAELVRLAGGERHRHALAYALECYPLIADSRDASVTPDARVSSIVNALLPGLRNAVLTHEVDRLSRLMDDLGLGFDQVKSRFEAKGFVPSGNTNKINLLDRYVKKNGLDGPAGVDDFLPFVAVATVALPGARVDTWPTALYEGVHGYNSGSPNADAYDLAGNLRQALFSERERREMLPLQLNGRSLDPPFIDHC